MGTETRYLIGLGAKLWKTGVSISSDVNGSAIGTGEIKKTHIHLLLLYIYIHIILQILSHQSHQLFLYAIIFKLLSMMHFWPRSSQPQFRKTRSSQPRLKLTCACINALIADVQNSRCVIYSCLWRFCITIFFYLSNHCKIHRKRDMGHYSI